MTLGTTVSKYKSAKDNAFVARLPVAPSAAVIVRSAVSLIDHGPGFRFNLWRPTLIIWFFGITRAHHCPAQCPTIWTKNIRYAASVVLYRFMVSTNAPGITNKSSKMIYRTVTTGMCGSSFNGTVSLTTSGSSSTDSVSLSSSLEIKCVLSSVSMLCSEWFRRWLCPLRELE